MIDDIKPVGAFFENTVRPFIGEFKWILIELDRQGIHMTEDKIITVTKHMADLLVKQAIIQLVKCAIITSIICYMVWKVLT